MRMKYAFFIFSSFLLLVSCFLFPPKAEAQFNSQLAGNVNVEISPENPGPNQSVNVYLTSYSTNINTANITWKVNGKTVRFGKGEKSFSFIVGDMQTTTTLSVVINTEEGETITKTVKIKPTSVDLIWQSDGFVPAFYKGKTFFSHQNRITFIALPHLINSSGQEISAKNLLYKWTKDGSVDEVASGFGKNTYTITPSIISRALDVAVEVTSSSNPSVGRAELVVQPIEPSVVIYKKSPLYGIEFEHALQNSMKLEDKELTIIAMPFYFGINPGALSYNWSINGEPIGQNSNIQVFRPKEKTSGTSNISLQVGNIDKILQSATADFNLKFGE